MTFVYHDCSDDARTIKKTHIHVRLGGHEIAWKLLEKKTTTTKPIRTTKTVEKLLKSKC